MIEIWRYKLRPSATLNATVSTGASICEGALVRMDGGYGCIHPWPTLGDASLDQQLLMLKQGEPSELARRALDCCIADGEARKEGRSLFEGLEQPRNHATIAAGETAASLVRRAPKFHSDGFAIVKIKSGPDVEFEAARVNAFAGEWLRLQPENRIRLDFNGSLDSLRLRQFVSMLRPESRETIDFIEDPLSYDAERWRCLQQETGLQFALDRGAERHESSGAFPVRVWKPACSPPPVATSSERLVVTSYMDHAIGQLFAAYEAARYPGQVDTCGLLTHPLFENDPFFQSLQVNAARLVVPSEPGLGFGAMLEALQWKPLP